MPQVRVRATGSVGVRACHVDHHDVKLAFMHYALGAQCGSEIAHSAHGPFSKTVSMQCSWFRCACMVEMVRLW
jgi:hypothetical protein